MKKLIFFAAVISFVSSVCFAQQSPVAVKQEGQSKAEIKTMAGKIESVTIADSAKRTNTELVVVDENGNKITFQVASAAVIHNSGMAVIGLDNLAKGYKVQVKYYTTAAGTNEATSVLLLK